MGKSLIKGRQEVLAVSEGATPDVKAENNVFYSCHGSWFALYSWLQDCGFDVELDLKVSVM